jgi:hypothetical protein
MDIHSSYIYAIVLIANYSSIASIELLKHFPIESPASLDPSEARKLYHLRDAVDAGIDMGIHSSYIYAIVLIANYSSIASIDRKSSKAGPEHSGLGPSVCRRQT